METKTSKTQQAQVTIDEKVIDSFSVELTLTTDAHAYKVGASWHASDGWDATITDEFGDEHDADTLAAALGYCHSQDLLATLTEGIYLTGESRFSVVVPAGV
jgi:hypothetical protein